MNVITKRREFMCQLPGAFRMRSGGEAEGRSRSNQCRVCDGEGAPLSLRVATGKRLRGPLARARDPRAIPRSFPTCIRPLFDPLSCVFTTRRGGRETRDRRIHKNKVSLKNYSYLWLIYYYMYYFCSESDIFWFQYKISDVHNYNYYYYIVEFNKN